MTKVCDICGKDIPENYKEPVVSADIMRDLVSHNYAPPEESVTRAVQAANGSSDEWLANWKTVTVPARKEAWHLCNDCVLPAVPMIGEMGGKASFILSMKGEPSGFEISFPVKPRLHGEDGKCAKCGRETEAGALYQFSYGNEIGRNTTSYTTGAMRKTTTTTTYEIAGKENVYFCYGCVVRHDVKDRKQGAIVLMAIFIVMVVAWFAIVFLFSMQDPAGAFFPIAIPLLGGALFGAWRYYNANKRLTTADDFDPNSLKIYQYIDFALIGDQLAINLRKEDIAKDEGYKMFFTRERKEITKPKKDSEA